MEHFEKVCKGLEHCAEAINPCSSCVYDKECKAAGTSNAAMADALALIRQQRERIKELEAAIAEWEKFAPFLYVHGMLPEPPKEDRE